MAFTPVTPIAAMGVTPGLITYSAVDNVNGNTFVNNGNMSLRVKNASGVSVTVTVISVPDPYGRTGDIIQVIAAGAEYEFPPLPAALFNQRSGDVGQVHVTFSVGASITLAVIQSA